MRNEWDLLAQELGIDWEPLALPMSRREVKAKLLAARGVPFAELPEEEDLDNATE